MDSDNKFLFLARFIDIEYMKNTSLVLFVVLFIAVAGLYILHFSGSKSKGSGNAGANGGSSAGLKIAYIKIDSLVVNYDFAQEMHDGFTKQQESFTKEYGEKRTRFESQAQAFQEKAQRGGFLTQETANKERERLMNEEQQITKLDQELSAKLAQIQADNNKQLLDSVLNYLKSFNKDKKYNYIFNAVGMNSRYSKTRKK